MPSAAGSVVYGDVFIERLLSGLCCFALIDLTSLLMFIKDHIQYTLSNKNITKAISALHTNTDSLMYTSVLIFCGSSSK